MKFFITLKLSVIKFKYQVSIMSSSYSIYEIEYMQLSFEKLYI